MWGKPKGPEIKIEDYRDMKLANKEMPKWLKKGWTVKETQTYTYMGIRRRVRVTYERGASSAATAAS